MAGTPASSSRAAACSLAAVAAAAVVVTGVALYMRDSKRSRRGAGGKESAGGVVESEGYPVSSVALSGCGEEEVDLEDFDVSAGTESTASGGVGEVKVGKRRRASVEGGRGREEAVGDVPGTQKVHVRTFGCSHNTSDGEFMMGQLAAYGYSLVDSLDDADVVVLNSCTVKNPSQDAFMTLVKRAEGLQVPVVAAGCVPQADRALPGLENVSVIGVTQIDRITEVVEEALRGNIIRLLGKKKLPSLDLPKIRRNPFVEIIPLSTGCLGACTYCKTRHARGKLGSYASGEILNRVQRAIAEGVQQIWLTSEDTGAYGLDIGTDIVELLEKVVESLPPHAMLRLGMTNPPYMLKHAEALARILQHDRVFEFLHVPVQSGSDPVLDAMKREYTVGDFDLLVGTLRKHAGDVTIATDIICGFPGETEEDHKASLELIERHRFPILNISQFYARPGTPAASMKRVHSREVKRRSREVTQLFESYSTNEGRVGKVYKVWFSETSSKSPHTVGHTKQFVKVLVDRDDSLLGQSRLVRVDAVSKWHLSAHVLQKPEVGSL
uniref:Threonylcarbamoyladenosine tRNA methylthiotransferase n=1 Tax=Chromera velia CCMP2878 TaxID=1169474 RepID=A0A0G4GDV1_9ALVE|eukprot:Cvel_21360.t1-p1 / transcript=Cvel_21360.t1 / gene=Cvel_21360 / organism=Chromera_velia_CCMP2878 / gene_product=Threonylcarbamoyladenosine tRNA, putative / transcript_product=Threonylcarbamoyladenosine tRNA, putative / location=Cvel_scaffold1996:22844-28997(+) / protein_length=551 / sequence_SO=supercontig / SO=protein_coding / is_pseudo=false